MPKRIVVAITGASGVIYGKRFVEFLAGSPHEVHLIVSDSAALVFRHELELELNLGSPAELLTALAGRRTENVICHEYRDLAAPVASGSFKTDGMVIIPCSMGTVGRVASGVSLSLVERAADVCLKERRKLVVVPRETPYSTIHLRNMLTLSEAGAVVLPASPGFYHGGVETEDLVRFILSRVLDHVGIENDLVKRYGEFCKEIADE